MLKIIRSISIPSALQTWTLRSNFWNKIWLHSSLTARTGVTSNWGSLGDFANVWTKLYKLQIISLGR